MINDPNYAAFCQAIRTMHLTIRKLDQEPLVSWDDKAQALQWIAKKVPDLCRLIVKIKTKEIADGGPKV